MKNKIVCNVSPIKDRTPTFEELAFDEQRKIDLEFTLADLAAETVSLANKQACDTFWKRQKRVTA